MNIVVVLSYRHRRVYMTSFDFQIIVLHTNRPIIPVENTCRSSAFPYTLYRIITILTPRSIGQRVAVPILRHERSVHKGDIESGIERVAQE